MRILNEGKPAGGVFPGALVAAGSWVHRKGGYRDVLTFGVCEAQGPKSSGVGVLEWPVHLTTVRPQVLTRSARRRIPTV